MDERCEAVTAHVALDLGDTIEHMVSICNAPAIGAYDDDGDDVTLCARHWPS